MAGEEIDIKDSLIDFLTPTLLPCRSQEIPETYVKLYQGSSTTTSNLNGPSNENYDLDLSRSMCPYVYYLLDICTNIVLYSLFGLQIRMSILYDLQI